MKIPDAQPWAKTPLGELLYAVEAELDAMDQRADVDPTVSATDRWGELVDCMKLCRIFLFRPELANAMVSNVVTWCGIL
jgi:hypothetical protein